MCHHSAILLLLFLSASILRGGQLPDGSATEKFATTLDLLDDRTVISPGDNLSIRVLEERRDREESKVAENGMIEIRYLGALKAEGLTCRKLAQLIRQKLLAVPAARRPFSSEAPTVVVAIDRVTCGLPSMDELDNTTQLKPGWTIGIRILEDKHEKLQQVIAVTGEIQAPYVGLVKAGGLTCAELAANIKGKLEESFFHHATVLVTLDSTESVPKEWAKGCFSEDVIGVFGNVAKAGKYELPQNGDLTVSGFLKWAGGHTSKKPLPKIQIVRKTPQGNKRILVDAEAILIRKSKEHDLFLRAYDVVLVD